MKKINLTEIKNKIFSFSWIKSDWFRITTAIIIVVAVLLTGYWAGFTKGSENPKRIIVEGVKNLDDSSNSVDFSLFWQVWETIKSKYVSKEKTDDNKNLLYGSISGLIDSLGDRNTSFFSPEEAKKFNEDISGEFGGIGAELGLDDGDQIIVIAPLKDTPAYRAGIESGDRIIKIDGESTIGMSVDQAVKKIRGKEGTNVKIAILRNGSKTEKEFDIKREVIQIPTLDFEKLNYEGKKDENGQIAYIKLYNFYEKSPYLFYQAAIKALMFGSSGMIIDLRDNPGGYLEAAVSIAGWFIPKNELIVREEFRNPSEGEEFRSSGPALLKDIPVVVIINKGSASASEILAGALKEGMGATLIGEKSFGKGTVQELVELKDGSLVKITIAHWLTPEGHQIDKNGILPDIEIKDESEQNGKDNDNLIVEASKILRSKVDEINTQQNSQ